MDHTLEKILARVQKPGRYVGGEYNAVVKAKEDVDCRFALWKENRYFDAIGKKLTKEIVKSLITSGRANLTKCRSRKSGRTYDALICMTTGTDGKPTFRMEFPDKKGAKRK